MQVGIHGAARPRTTWSSLREKEFDQPNPDRSPSAMNQLAGLDLPAPAATTATAPTASPTTAAAPVVTTALGDHVPAVAVGLDYGLADLEGAAVEFELVELQQRGHALLGGAEAHEAEAAGSAAVAVGDDGALGDLAAALGKRGAERVLGGVPGEVSDVEAIGHGMNSGQGWNAHLGQSARP